MAVVSHTLKRFSNCFQYTWLNVDENDTFEAVDTNADRLPGAPVIVSMQAEDTYGGATLVLNGSLDGSMYRGLDDKSGDAISLTAVTDGIVETGEAALYYQPSASGGSSQSLDVTLVIWFARGN